MIFFSHILYNMKEIRLKYVKSCIFLQYLV